MRVRRPRRSAPPDLAALRTRALAEALFRLRAPAEIVLTAALRRIARRNGAVFERLGPYRNSGFVIAPSDLPVAFRLTPSGADGRIAVVRPADPGPFAARICGPLLDLLDLFDGSLDADAAFFSRTLLVEGDTAAVVALHNALEAADLGLVDLLGLPVGRGAAEAALSRLARAARRHAAARG